ncbi:MAG: hypothetical protein CSYNP_01487 [Syntrophus sp. SKADARSKE-3]|nr:hypothetical protein [Syntrophus sp. SKADARSKE-3]
MFIYSFACLLNAVVFVIFLCNGCAINALFIISNSYTINAHQATLLGQILPVSDVFFALAEQLSRRVLLWRGERVIIKVSLIDSTVAQDFSPANALYFFTLNQNCRPEGLDYSKSNVANI